MLSRCSNACLLVAFPTGKQIPSSDSFSFSITLPPLIQSSFTTHSKTPSVNPLNSSLAAPLVYTPRIFLQQSTITHLVIHPLMFKQLKIRLMEERTNISSSTKHSPPLVNLSLCVHAQIFLWHATIPPKMRKPSYPLNFFNVAISQNHFFNFRIISFYFPLDCIAETMQPMDHVVKIFIIRSWNLFPVLPTLLLLSLMLTVFFLLLCNSIIKNLSEWTFWPFT